MITLIDQLGYELEFEKRPRRIVCLVPSISKTLIDLGIGDRLLGITKFCNDPILITATIPKIGGTKNPNIEKIISLCPDLIICNKEENRQEDILLLKSKNIPVYISDIISLEESNQMIKDMGVILDNTLEANKLVEKIGYNFNTKMLPIRVLPYKIVYLIWKNPYMVVANQTFIQSMLKLCGFENLFLGMERYPQISETALMELKSDFIFLSIEPYPFNETDVCDFLPNRAVLVDGKAFSWYGSYLLQSFDYFHALIHQLNKIYDNEPHL